MDNGTYSLICETFGFRPAYVWPTSFHDVVEAVVNHDWLRSIIKELKLTSPPSHEIFSEAEVQSSIHLSKNCLGPCWSSLFIQCLPKENTKVFPLPRSNCQKTNLSQDVSYSQLLHYVSTLNAKNLWKDAYKKYSYHCVALQNKDPISVELESQESVLLESIRRLYKCPIIKIGDSQSSLARQSLEPHSNILPALFVIDTSSHFFIFLNHVNYNVRQCVTFSPAKLQYNEEGALYLLYQLLDVARSLHDEGLCLGDISLDHMLLDETFFLSLMPRIEDSLLRPDSSAKTSPSLDPEDNMAQSPLDFKAEEDVNVKGYLKIITSDDAKEVIWKWRKREDSVQISEENSSLVYLTYLWVCHKLSNMDYLLCLNFFCGRQFGNPHSHPTLPWVTDFSSRTGNWRDLRKTKFRLNKGDTQLDHTYHMTGESKEVAHHVTEVFSEITYYVYKARITPKEILTKYIRKEWVPEHYPATISRMYDWTPDECIPEFYLDPSIFKSIHPDLSDLLVPVWCSDVNDFLESHRNALESTHVSSYLHTWIDLNFGYKLSGNAAMKAKNVCLQLVDSHTNLMSSGVVKLFSIPHPQRFSPSPYLGRFPPIINPQRSPGAEKSRNMEASLEGPHREEIHSSRSLLYSRKISHSRTSLDERSSISAESSIQLPSSYNPLHSLNQLEMFYNFVLKTSRRIPKDFKPETKEVQLEVKQAVYLRRVRDLQVVGCIAVELFAPSKCNILSNMAGLEERYFLCRKIFMDDRECIPRCLRTFLKAILQTDVKNLSSMPDSFPPISSTGLPPLSSYQFMRPVLDIIYFPLYFPLLYSFITLLKEYSRIMKNSKFYCLDLETRLELLEKVADLRVKTATRDLPKLLSLVTEEGLMLLLPSLLELFECDYSSVTASWYLTGCISQMLGPNGAVKNLLPIILKLFETDHMNDKFVKLFHRSFLLQIQVWFGLKTFLQHFVTPLIEGVGGYKEGNTCCPGEEIKMSKTLKNVEFGFEDCLTSPIEEESYSSAAERTLKLDSEDSQELTEADFTDPETEPDLFIFDGPDNEASVFSPVIPLQESMDLRSPVASDTLSLDEPSLQDGTTAPSPCASPHSVSTNEEEVTYSQSSAPSGLPVGKSEVKPSGTVKIPSLSTSEPAQYLCVEAVPHSFSSTDDSVHEIEEAYEPDESCGPEKQLPASVGLMSKSTIGDVCSESVLWLSHRIGPVLTSRYLTRNLLRMLALCFLPDSDALLSVPADPCDELSITRKRVLGDNISARVINCLVEIACIYGEQVILLQYLCHISELVASCRQKISSTLEGGLVGCMTLFQTLLTLISDSSFMEHLQEMFIKSIVYPVIELLSSTTVEFQSGCSTRAVLAWRVIDCLFLMSLRVGREMSKKILTSAIIHFFSVFDRAFPQPPSSGAANENQSTGSRTSVQDDKTEMRSREVYSEVTKTKATEELKDVLTPELAYLSYIPFCRFLGASYLESVLPNAKLIKSLCIQYDDSCQSDKATVLSCVGSLSSGAGLSARPPSGQLTSVAVKGNRIDIEDSVQYTSPFSTQLQSSLGIGDNFDVTKYTSRLSEPSHRHLRGNWLAYWEHEIGRCEQDKRFNFKQIKLQTFSGHTSSVKSLYVLDNENSFVSCSKDKTVKLWSLRSQGNGNVHCGPQWTYTGHKKSVFGVTFSERMRLAASCDSTVHIWDPFIGGLLKQLDSLKHSPVTVLTSLAPPSPLLVAATTDATLRFIDLRTCSYAHEFKVSVSGAGLVRCVSPSQEGDLIAVAHSSGVISVLDVKTGQLLSSWKPHEGEVLNVQWYKSGIFVSSALDQTVCGWSVDDKQYKFTLRGPTEPVHLISIFNDELITGTTANRIGIHTSISPSASFSSTRLRSDAFRGVLTSMAVLPLNRLLLLGADNGNIRLLC